VCWRKSKQRVWAEFPRGNDCSGSYAVIPKQKRGNHDKEMWYVNLERTKQDSPKAGISKKMTSPRGGWGTLGGEGLLAEGAGRRTERSKVQVVLLPMWGGGFKSSCQSRRRNCIRSP